LVRYVVRRIATMVPLLILVTAFVFFLGQYGAGDMAMQIVLQANNNSFDPEMYAALRRELGLDQPAAVRFLRFLLNALRGDFGRSYVIPGTPEIGRIMAAALPISAQLALASVLIVMVVGIPLGILTAIWRNTAVDYGVVMVVTILSSVPAFVFVPVAMWLVVVKLKLIPSVGLGWQGLFHIETLLPAVCMAIGPILGVVRYTRASVSDVLSQEYIRAARARGLPAWRVVRGHVIKNAMTPVLTVLGLSAGYLLSGSIFVESAFNYRGFGWVSFNAFRGGDIQTVAASTLISALIIMSANLVVDLLYGFLDPRVKLVK
jgi:peptide/nickel transport system permease protein